MSLSTVRVGAERFIRFSAIELCLALALALLGVWLLAWRAQAVSTGAYLELLRRADEWAGSMDPTLAMELSAFCVGGLHAAAVLINGRGIPWTPVVRVTCCALSSIWMANWAHGFAAANVASTAVFTYGLWTCLYLLAFWSALDRLQLGIWIGGCLGRTFRGR